MHFHCFLRGHDFPKQFRIDHPGVGKLFQRAEVALRRDHLIERVPTPEIVVAEVLAGVAVVDVENLVAGGLMKGTEYSKTRVR